MAPEKRATPPLAPLQRAVLSRIEFLCLTLLFVLGFLFAWPPMTDSYTGAVLSGKCAQDPKPALCTPPPVEVFGGGIAWTKVR